MNRTVLTNKLHTKNVYQILGEAFFIPAYQRGYRWSALQVKELLDDIWEFCQKKEENDSAFYCLQPIVVARGSSNWQVVDGQQRLTTIYLILNYLEKEHLRRPLEEAYKKSLYTISYETRLDCQEFLQNIQTETNTHNIDFFHMTKAYQAIVDWFADKDYNDNIAFITVLLAKPSDTVVTEPNAVKAVKLKEPRSVKFIWYDLSDECEGNDYAINVFSRINIGKIPLTNAELVKALFLQQKRFTETEVELKQLQIATEWDAIEKRLQEPRFWHFIYKSGQNKEYTTRIEYIFDLMKEKKSDNEAFFTFHKFSSEFKDENIKIEDLWKEVKSYFLTFEEWYRDRELYHKIGFLVDCGHDVAKIKSDAKNSNTTKSEFKAYLKDKVRMEVNCQLSDLIYGESRIKKVLLLFNIQTLLASKESDARFPFDRYKQENWDIEHIRSQTDTNLTGKNREDWLNDLLVFFNRSSTLDTPQYQDFVDEINKLNGQQKMDEVAFISLYQNVRKKFDESEEVEWIDGLGNLTLLDAATNRSYKNSLFPVKRARIIQNDMQSVFVPICTKNVFLKFYSKSVDNLMYWRQSDANDYLEKIGEVLLEFLPQQGEKNG